MDNAPQATGADPIFLGQLVAAHVKATYPKGVVVVCAPDVNGSFNIDLMENAFGKEAVRDVSSIANLAVVRFPEGTDPDRVLESLRRADEESEDDEPGGYTIYSNGESVVDDVFP